MAGKEFANFSDKDVVCAQKFLVSFVGLQVMIVKGIAKKYLGAIGSEQRAARLYDKYAIII